MICKFENCDRPARKLELCSAHYLQKWAGKDLSPLRLKIANGTGSKSHRKEQSANYMRKYNYDLTQTEYLARLVFQDCKCAICQEDFVSKDKQTNRTKAISVDHDHVTGVVRGLLCFHCNLGLGHFRDNRESLNKALVYLEENYSD